MRTFVLKYLSLSMILKDIRYAIGRNYQCLAYAQKGCCTIFFPSASEISETLRWHYCNYVNFLGGNQIDGQGLYLVTPRCVAELLFIF